MFDVYDFEEQLCSKPANSMIAIGVFVAMLFPVAILKLIEVIRAQPEPNPFAGKVVLVTGASSGLGEAFASEYYRLGCKVILSSRNGPELERVCKKIVKKYEGLRCIRGVRTYNPLYLTMDLSDLQSIPDKAEAALECYGHIDILINNAGISCRGSAISTDINVDMKVMLVNYFGHVALTKAILPSMISRNQGTILFVSSIQGLIGIPNRSAYVASKHALQGFCDSLRAEVAAYNIKVSVLSPGYMKTKLSQNALTGDGRLYGVTDRATANGLEPRQVAYMTRQALTENQKEIIIAGTSPKLAVFLRHLFPGLFFRGMELRARIKK